MLPQSTAPPIHCTPLCKVSIDILIRGKRRASSLTGSCNSRARHIYIYIYIYVCIYIYIYTSYIYIYIYIYIHTHTRKLYDMAHVCIVYIARPPDPRRDATSFDRPRSDITQSYISTPGLRYKIPVFSDPAPGNKS